MNGGLRRLIRTAGSLNSGLATGIARRIDDLVEALLEAAVAEWAAEEWRRFDNLEQNCVVRIYDHCLRTKRIDPSFEWIGVTAEWHQFDPEMLDGSKSSITAKRPDLRFVIGEASRLFEAKCLACEPPFPGNYVNRGIVERFISGRYIVDGNRAGMLGFLIAEPVDQVLPAVNAAIDNCPTLTADDRIHHHRALALGHDVCHSNHLKEDGDPVHLTHHMVQVEWTFQATS